MATNSNGSPITTARANVNAGLAIVRTGTVQQVAFANAARPPKGAKPTHIGYTLAELRTRLLAADAPLWAREVRTVDYTFMVNRTVGPRARAAGVTHAYRHDTPKGTPTQCMGHGGDTCSHAANSVGDSARRWRHDGTGELPADCKALARKALASHVAALRARVFGSADILATPSVAIHVAAGVGTVAGDAPKRARKARKAKVEQPATVEATPEAPPLDAN